MLVGNRMSSPVITVHLDTPMEDALNLMHRERVRRLPVVDSHGKLIGIVSERQLLKEHPSEATTLSIWEMRDMLRKVTIKKLMTPNVTTITEDATIEEAAKIMTEGGISGLPVMRGDKLVGMITEKDIFKLFLELMGSYEHGIRVTVQVPEKPGVLAKLSQKIFDIGGNIIALGNFLAEDSSSRKITFKIANVDQKTLETAILPLVEEITDIRESPAG